jgi:hypothetical protein
MRAKDLATVAIARPIAPPYCAVEDFYNTGLIRTFFVGFFNNPEFLAKQHKSSTYREETESESQQQVVDD